ncbi:MAG: tetratricopeptide repeat protein [Verrucomicrobia bacterium]|nr:tetratricopeptide repeat protein [Verrucomicrobiota bacterium]
MEPTDPPPPIPPDPTTGGPDAESSDDPAKPGLPAKRLTAVKPPRGRRGAGKKGSSKPGQKGASGNVTGRFFRRVVGRGSVKPPPGEIFQPTGAGVKKARHVGWMRLLRFYWKLFRRHVRRFHARFTIGQILGFYLGVPAAISLTLCLAILFAKPPQGIARRAVPQRTPPAMELIQQIQSALVAHDGSAAKVAVSELEEFYPKDPRTFVASGTVWAHEKKYDEARKSYLRALELAPGLPTALINLGEVEFASGDYTRAAGYYERAGKRLPQNPLILFRRYLCYSLLDERPMAGEVMKELSVHPNSVEWYYVQASEALRAGNKPEAQRLIATAGTLFGEQAAAYQESLKKIGWLK